MTNNDDARQALAAPFEGRVEEWADETLNKLPGDEELSLGGWAILEAEMIDFIQSVRKESYKAGLLKASEIVGVVEMPQELFRLDAKKKYWMFAYLKKISEAIRRAVAAPLGKEGEK